MTFFNPGDLVLIKDTASCFAFRHGADYWAINIKKVDAGGDVAASFMPHKEVLGMVIRQQCLTLRYSEALCTGPLLYVQVLVGDQAWFIYEEHLALL